MIVKLHIYNILFFIVTMKGLILCKKMKLLSKIESIDAISFPAKKKKLGKYILEHSSEVTILSTQTLSKLCDVSEPTLIRFTRKLGYSGYREFKLKLTAEYVSDPISGT